MRWLLRDTPADYLHDRHRVGGLNGDEHPPFDWSVTYENEQWWDEVRYYYVGEPWFVQVLEGGVELARVELDNPGGPNRTWAKVSSVGPKRLEVQFIEVANTARDRGIETRVVQALVQRHPDRRLFAYSQEADSCWASLGWDRFDHREGPQFHRPLFIPPARNGRRQLGRHSCSPLWMRRLHTTRKTP